MSKYRKICPKIWNDRKFVSMSDDGKMVFFFLLTHPHMTPLGAMRGTIAGLASELDWPIKKLSEALAEALAHGMVKIDSKASCISIPKFLKHNQPESVNVVKAWASCVDDIPECTLRDECMVNAQTLMVSKSVAFAKAFEDAFGDSSAMPSSKPCLIQEQEQEQEEEQDQDKKTTLSDYSKTDSVIDYFNEKSNSSYKHKDSSRKNIHARLAEGFTVDDCKLVIDFKVDAWLGDPKMEQYLRPITVFGLEKFEGYLNAAKRWAAGGRKSTDGSSPRRVVTRPGEYNDVFDEA